MQTEKGLITVSEAAADISELLLKLFNLFGSERLGGNCQKSAKMRLNHVFDTCN